MGKLRAKSVDSGAVKSACWYYGGCCSNSILTVYWKPFRESLENTVAQAPDPTQLNQNCLVQAWALIFL